MGSAFRRWMVVWLLMALPWQVLSAVQLDLRGPAHVHTHHDGGPDHDHDHDDADRDAHADAHADGRGGLLLPRDFTIAHDDRAEDAHGHHHDGVARHWHAEGGGDDAIIVMAADDLWDEQALFAGFGNLFVTLLPALPVITVVPEVARRRGERPRPWRSQHPVPLERPPILA